MKKAMLRSTSLGFLAASVTLAGVAFGGDKEPVTPEKPVVPQQPVTPPQQGQQPVVTPPQQGQQPIVTPPQQGQQPVVTPPQQGQQGQVGQGGQQGQQGQYIPAQYQSEKKGEKSQYNNQDLRVVRYGGGAFGGAIHRNVAGLSVILDQPRYCDYIEFYAHDNIGSRSNGLVDLYLDGQLFERGIEIKKAGRMYRIPLNRSMQLHRIDFIAREDEVEVGYVDVGMAY